MKIFSLGLLLLLVFSSTRCARSRESPYVGSEVRSIKALSAEQQSALLEGKGMGFALAAELNHFPGPLHVLELAGELGLSEDQQRRTKGVFESMRTTARALGSSIVELEAQLDGHFSQRSITAKILESLIGEIAALSGQLRATHLHAHLEMIEILDSEQILQYDELRGYDGDAREHDPSRHHAR